MIIEIDFQSDEAIYMQLRNQIILGSPLPCCEGDPLPSVRQLAEDVGINMHTVNKAYSVLRQEGFVTIDRSAAPWYRWTWTTEGSGGDETEPEGGAGQGQLPEHQQAGGTQPGG